ncbi:O-antigen ligase family protein [Armatimonas sp.]|uniref:O-antigen ligase family protein n=1 Tax=Armatimonas sp. TaxID=1872638 RepID=UPI00286BCD32|nr:O-antigen ligase family protein [Armatimonas sp.]
MDRIDPWHKREVERRNFEKHNVRKTDFINEVKKKLNAILFLICISVFLTSEVPSILSYTRLWLSVFGVLALSLLILINRDYSEKILIYIKKPSDLLIIFSFIYYLCTVFVYQNKNVGIGEIIRLLSGMMSFFVSSCVLKNKKNISFVIYGIVFICSAISIYDISHYARKVGLGSHFSADVSLLGTHESIGSLLAMVLPLSLILCFRKLSSENIKLFAYSTSIIISFAWIMVRCRSAWLGGIIGLIVMALLMMKFTGERETKQRINRKNIVSQVVASPLLWIVGGLIVIAIFGGLGPALAGRASSLGSILEDNSSLDGRFIMWEGALRMLSEKPIFGWGLGGYLLLQGRWTNLGDSPEQVILYGTGHQNIAHNYYVQWFADTGVVGGGLLLLSVCVLLAFGLKALRLARHTEDRTLLIACSAALIGALAEVNGSPAFQFCGVWVIFWAIAGALMSGVREVDQDTPVRLAPSTYAIIFIFVASVCGSLVWYGNRLWDPHGTPRGIFQIVEETKGPYYPGDRVRWRALYRDGKGKEQGSHPGTKWIAPLWVDFKPTTEPRPVKTQDIFLLRAVFSTSDLLRGFSELSLRLPPGETGMVQIQATFSDQFGRNYDASRVIEVVKK